MLRKACLPILALTLACSDSDPVPPADPGSIQVAVNPGTVSIAAGGNGSVNVALTRSGNFTGSVTLVVTGLPSGIIATSTPTTLPAGATTASINVTVAAGVAPGSYAATVSGFGEGVTQATAPLQVVVTPPPAFTLSIPSGGPVIATGGSGTLTVTLQRTNFTGTIDLALVNPPSGITATVTPPNPTGNAALITLIVSPAAAPGVIPLILRGRAQGMTDRTVTFDLTIRAPVAGARVEYTFCDPTNTPLFFAFQDGTGAWQQVAPAGLGNSIQFAFDIANGRGGVLMIFRTSTFPSLISRAARMQVVAHRSRADIYETIVKYATTHELVQDGFETCAATQPSNTNSVTVGGVPLGAFGIVSFGRTTEIFDPATSTNPISFTDVPVGLNDLAGSRSRPGQTPDRILMIRNLTPPNGGLLPPIDFNTSPTFTPATAQVTITGGQNDLFETFVNVVTANSHLGLWSELSSSTATTRTWAGLRSEDMASSDFHGLIVFANAADSSGDFRVSLRYVDYVTNQTLALGGRVALPAITQLSGGSYPRLRFQGLLPIDYDRGAGFTVSDSTGSSIVHVAATHAYLAATGSGFSYDLAMPDVIGLPNFPVASALTFGMKDVVIDVFGFNGPGVFDLVPTRGGEFKASVRNTTTLIQQ